MCTQGFANFFGRQGFSVFVLNNDFAVFHSPANGTGFRQCLLGIVKGSHASFHSGIVLIVHRSPPFDHAALDFWRTGRGGIGGVEARLQYDQAVALGCVQSIKLFFFAARYAGPVMTTYMAGWSGRRSKIIATDAAVLAIISGSVGSRRTPFGRPVVPDV